MCPRYAQTESEARHWVCVYVHVWVLSRNINDCFVTHSFVKGFKHTTLVPPCTYIVHTAKQPPCTCTCTCACACTQYSTKLMLKTCTQNSLKQAEAWGDMDLQTHTWSHTHVQLTYCTSGLIPRPAVLFNIELHVQVHVHVNRVPTSIHVHVRVHF